MDSGHTTNSPYVVPYQIFESWRFAHHPYGTCNVTFTLLPHHEDNTNDRLASVDQLARTENNESIAPTSQCNTNVSSQGQRGPYGTAATDDDQHTSSYNPIQDVVYHSDVETSSQRGDVTERLGKLVYDPVRECHEGRTADEVQGPASAFRSSMRNLMDQCESPRRVPLPESPTDTSRRLRDIQPQAPTPIKTPGSHSSTSSTSSYTLSANDDSSPSDLLHLQRSIIRALETIGTTACRVYWINNRPSPRVYLRYSTRPGRTAPYDRFIDTNHRNSTDSNNSNTRILSRRTLRQVTADDARLGLRDLLCRICDQMWDRAVGMDSRQEEELAVNRMMELYGWVRRLTRGREVTEVEGQVLQEGEMMEVFLAARDLVGWCLWEEGKGEVEGLWGVYCRINGGEVPGRVGDLMW